MEKFKAYRLREADRKVTAAFEQMSIDELDKGEVVIRVAYSDVNYKDALAATGKGRIIRRFPCVGGIDLSGTVVESSDARFAKGDAVIATSYDIGVAHDGGYAEYARIPADWVVKMPRGLNLAEAMALGTAGYTAALGVVRMEQVGLKPGNGPVIVSGATGGVGSMSIKSLEAATWAGAVDNLGGEVLAWMAASMLQGGAIASIGLAASMSLNTSVAPFILRGVSLLGIDSGYTPMPLREEVWRRLATDMKPAHLQTMVRTIAFDELPTVFDDFINAKIRGRIVVDLSA